ncbi:hypothetical protein AMECASPLE_024279 [Ameca splendens]|uniref:Uncharacterized protein n=1 Tax=Ameca splendens TaxID=208324 RepID=A0ABV0YFE4_9TELE
MDREIEFYAWRLPSGLSHIITAYYLKVGMLRAPLLLPPAPVHLPFSGRPTTPPSSPALVPSVFAPVSTPCTPPLTTLSGFASFLPSCGFNLTVWACSNKLFTAGGLVMAEGVHPEDYCDEPVEDEFGEIIKCRSAGSSS